jgi:hypothetical protein
VESPLSVVAMVGGEVLNKLLDQVDLVVADVDMYILTRAVLDFPDRDTRAAQEYGKDLDRLVAGAGAVLLVLDNKATETQVVPAARVLLFWDLLWVAVVVVVMEIKAHLAAVRVDPEVPGVAVMETVIMHSPTQAVVAVVVCTAAKRLVDAAVMV